MIEMKRFEGLMLSAVLLYHRVVNIVQIVVIPSLCLYICLWNNQNEFLSGNAKFHINQEGRLFIKTKTFYICIYMCVFVCMYVCMDVCCNLRNLRTFMGLMTEHCHLSVQVIVTLVHVSVCVCVLVHVCGWVCVHTCLQVGGYLLQSFSTLFFETASLTGLVTSQKAPDTLLSLHPHYWDYTGALAQYCIFFLWVLGI